MAHGRDEIETPFLMAEVIDICKFNCVCERKSSLLREGGSGP